ncbi:hypothetical protein K470DRAFT_272906 [Piedraia hortae CBS 480.64]|uniref:HTH psq-type domain-containing protein n=1 Tax=Piedraia hortae CBS 480.64 TaxID=1314780 RepID=A0A6A7BRR8_9PEZI|nr:hypothetical protein K470DRAFT_272906 [Piedraia hortae CBS 480.64]
MQLAAGGDKDMALFHPSYFPVPGPDYTNFTFHPQPFVPQWPSMLPVYTKPAPRKSSSAGGRALSSPRRTLTDQDRRAMCEYAREHPDCKQTDIGALFGVERSTVSKVLRLKDKYLKEDDKENDSRDAKPSKRAKAHSPKGSSLFKTWNTKQKKGTATPAREVGYAKSSEHTLTLITTSEVSEMFSSDGDERFQQTYSVSTDPHAAPESRCESLAPSPSQFYPYPQPNDPYICSQPSVPMREVPPTEEVDPLTTWIDGKLAAQDNMMALPQDSTCFPPSLPEAPFELDESLDATLIDPTLHSATANMSQITLSQSQQPTFAAQIVSPDVMSHRQMPSERTAQDALNALDCLHSFFKQNSIGLDFEESVLLGRMKDRVHERAK